MLMITKVWRNVSGDGQSMNAGCDLPAQKCFGDRFVDAVFSSTESSSVSPKLDHILKHLSLLNLKISWKNPYWNSLEDSKRRTTCIQPPTPFWACRLPWPRAVVFPETVESCLVTPGCKSHPKSCSPPSSLKGKWKESEDHLQWREEKKMLDRGSRNHCFGPIFRPVESEANKWQSPTALFPASTSLFFSVSPPSFSSNLFF